jgi:acyl carrier protein
MSDKDHRIAVLSFFAERGKRIPGDDVDLLDSGIIDSMDLVELVAHLETQGVDIPHEAMSVDNFRSISAIVATCARGARH